MITINKLTSTTGSIYLPFPKVHLLWTEIIHPLLLLPPSLTYVLPRNQKENGNEIWMSDQVSEKCDKCESVGVRVGVWYLGPNLGPLGRVACRTCVTGGGVKP